jgi:hypothetical protein
VAGCCECGDEPSGSCATELVSWLVMCVFFIRSVFYAMPAMHFLAKPPADRRGPPVAHGSQFEKHYFTRGLSHT